MELAIQHNIKIGKGKNKGLVYQRTTPCFKGSRFLRGGNPSCDNLSMARKVAIVNVLTNGEGTCRWCGHGDIDVLTIDHIHGGGGKHRRELGFYGGGRFYTWLIKRDYPEGYQVLCFNCNWKKKTLDWRKAKASLV